MAAAVTGAFDAKAEFSSRTEIAPHQIEAALGARWRKIAERAKEQAAPPVTRAFLWNLIISGPTVTRELIDELAAELPARALVLSRPSDGDGVLRVFVETNVAGTGRHAVGSDEVTIEIGGASDVARASQARVPSIVRSALVPDALTALVWVGPPPSEDDVTHAFVPEVDRLILDSRRLDAKAGEAGLAAIVGLGERHPHLDLADLAWLGISPLRGLLASLFDPPHDPAPLHALDEVSVVSGVDAPQVRALLMFGWLGARLGWRAPKAEASTSGARTFTATRADGRPVRLRISVDQTGAKHGAARLELRAGDRRWSLDRDQHKITVAAPDLPPRQQPARSHTLAERLAEALGSKGHDANYRGALAFAAALAAEGGR